MSLRSSVPVAARGFVRRSYVQWGALTARYRTAPDFLVVGGQRCGTTSLFRALEQHQDIVRPTFNKGINYFDINHHRGSRWYRGHFPLMTRRRAANGSVSFEASGYYMFHPLAPERIAMELPNVKIIAMLRDPVERAYSAWKHESARGFDDLPFEIALEKEADRTRGEREKMVADPSYHSISYRHQSYAARGDYVAQMQGFYDRLPATQIHVMYSEDFFAEPASEFARLTDFLGVPRAQGLVFDQHNARPSGPMPGHSREFLTEVFAGQSDALEVQVGRRPPWNY